jgi:hypothetical protein
MLFGIWTLNDDLVQHKFKLAHVVPVCPGDDYRQRDTTPVH